MLKLRERPKNWCSKWKKDPKLDSESEKRPKTWCWKRNKDPKLEPKIEKDPKPDAAKSEKKDLMQNLNLTILASQKAVKSF